MSTNYLGIFEKCETVSACLELREELMNQGEAMELKTLLTSAIDKDSKKELGARLNQIRKEVYQACDQKIQNIQQSQEKDNFIEFDPTFYSNNYKTGQNGNLHPVTQVAAELVDISSKMGFDVYDGPQIESQWYNFTSVGTPDYHPARGMQDTFFTDQKDESDENMVMRTQVTANIARYAKSHKPPFRVVFPGIVFRAENIDATHDINFHQFDMWLIDKQASISQLTTLIQDFFRQFFDDPNLKARFRPSYFPFTQPSFEIDIYSEWFKGGRWIEVAGAGPIHRQVLNNIGLDEREWQGIAFGFGVTRLAQLKLQITGLGQFYNGQLSFLRGSEY